MIFANNNRK
jgi:hypothetical protein